MIEHRNVPSKLAFGGRLALKLPTLLSLIVQFDPKLLEDRDPAGRGALYYAIQMKLEWFIKALLDIKTLDKEVWQRVLCTGPNCIHMAISVGLRPSLIVGLIENVSKNMLAAQDDSGLTPLHLAVEYSRCTKERRKIVRALLEHGDSALDKRGGSKALSVYQHHMASREQHGQKEKKGTIEKRNEIPALKLGEKPGKEEKQDSKEQEEAEPISEKAQKEERVKEQKMRQGGRRRSTAVHDDAQRASTPPTQCNEGRQLSDVQPVAQAPTPSVDQPSIKPATSKRKPDNVAREIAKLLKLHYFRTTFSKKHRSQAASPRDHGSAVEFLFGDNDDCKLIGFEFPPTPRKNQAAMDFDRFKDAYKRFSFDPALLYVDFRKVEFQDPDIDNPRALKRPQQAGAGRRDMVKFFDWLYTEKRVRDIIKVTVEDSEGMPHCDEAIVASLERFSIEILDWRKLDLCPLAIQRASAKSKNIRQLHLWWSGSNAVLRAWSERQGLALLPSLEKIHIY